MADSATLLQKLNDKILESYNTVTQKGGTAPGDKNMDNLPDAIKSIPEGGGGSLNPSEYFDGGEYGAIMYLGPEGAVVKHMLTEDAPLSNVNSSTSSRTFITLDGFAVTNENLLAYSYGTKQTSNLPSGNNHFQSCKSLRAVHGLDKTSVTTIGSSFLQGCSLLNAPIILSANLTSIKGSFLSGCAAFSSSISFAEGRADGTPLTLSYGFMNECASFNHPSITNFVKQMTDWEGTSSLIDQAASFFYACTSLNQSLEFNSKLKKIPYGFLYNCTSFNQPITIPAGIQVGPDTPGGNYRVASLHSFLYGCTSFNSPVTFKGEATQTDALDNFLRACSAFNQPIVLPEGITAVTNFLRDCTNFNSTITAPGLTDVGNYFLYGNKAIIKEAPLPPTVTTIGNYFMQSSALESWTMPNSITSIGTYFLNYANNLTSLNVGKASGFTSENYTLSTSTYSALMYQQGITLSGENAQAWKDGLPDRTSSPYRKLIVQTNPIVEFKKALDNGTAEQDYPVGTEIPDKWDGEDNPLIVAQYLDDSNNSEYGGARGGVLIRKYATTETYAFSDQYADYQTSPIRSYLDTEYLDKTSDELKPFISEISIPVVDYYKVHGQVDSKWFLMSSTEVCAVESLSTGIIWDYWKKQTGWTSGSNAPNAGRIVYDRNGAAQFYWLRSCYSASNEYAMDKTGYVGGYNARNYSFSLLPACFIAKSE